MNYLHYIDHTLFSPTTYFRRYDFDLSLAPDVAKQVLLAALPFIGLWKPAGTVLSITMNGTRSFSHLSNLLKAEGNSEWKKCGIETIRATLALLALATTVFHFTAALLVTTSSDALQSGMNTTQALWNREYSKALEEGLQAISSIAYLNFMVMGGLEAMVVFAIFQGFSALYQARSEFKQGHKIEGTAKLLMAGIRFNQAHVFIKQIQRRNALLEFEKFRALFIKMERAKSASHLVHHPLSSLKERIEGKEVILQDEKGNDAYFGSHFHGHGKGLVKGENLIFRTKIVDGKEILEFDFKINHAYRADLEETLNQLNGIRGKDQKEILSFTGSKATGVIISSGSFLTQNPNSYFQIGSATKIQINGLGSILIGASETDPNLFDRVVLQIPADKTIYDLHEMLCWVNLDTALYLSSQDDIERLKMGHLFRTFFPREATPFERTKEYFEIPIADLKAKMIEKSPEMHAIFETYYPKMSAEHLFDGRIRYRIEGLADAARAEGAKALTSAIMGAHDDKELYDRVTSMLRIGMLATTVRHDNDFGRHGLGGGGVDYVSGGADSVYTQLLTEKMIQDQREFEDFRYESEVRLLISLEALELGSYQYHTDALGNRMYRNAESEFNWWWWREPESYADRENILEFIKNEQTTFNYGHEVMLKERIAPSFFQGLIVNDEQTKDALIKHLQSKGLIENGLILGKPLEKFIHISESVSEELFT